MTESGSKVMAIDKLRYSPKDAVGDQNHIDESIARSLYYP